MIFWIDAQLSPAIAGWITLTFAVTAFPLRDIGLTCGNTANASLRQMLTSRNAAGSSALGVWPGDSRDQLK
jgi:hypothetical protein